MPRSDQAIRAWLDHLEREVRTRPGRHKLRLIGLAMLGYLYPIALLVGCVAVVTLLVVVAPAVWDRPGGEMIFLYGVVAIVALTVCGVVLRVLFVNAPRPVGHVVKKEESPEIWKMVDEVRVKMRAPKVHELHLSTQYNAAAAQRRRFGWWGWRRNYVMLGLPLMISLTPEQLRSVLAHEIGHLRGRHNSFTAWIYRVQSTWQKLAAPFASGKRLRYWIMGWFVKWYSQYFGYSTLAVRRLHEYEADGWGGEVASREETARALMTISWLSYRLEKAFWPNLIREARHEPLPPADLLGRMTELFDIGTDDGSLRRWVERERSARTPITAEHPCLSDRLRALSCGEYLRESAAAQVFEQGASRGGSSISLLGAGKDRAWKILNASWKAELIDRWRREHWIAKHLREEREKAEVDEKVSAKERAWEQIELDVSFAPMDEAAAKLREFLVQYPDHAGANHALGRMLLEQDDLRAVEHLGVAMKHGSEFIGPCLQMLLAYYRELGRDDQAEPIRRRLEEHEEQLIASQKERLRVGRRDRLMPHDLSRKQVEKVRRVLFRYPKIQAAYLAQKQVKLFGDQPSYVLGIECYSSLLEDLRMQKHLLESLRSELPVACAICVLDWKSWGMRGRFMKVCEAPIFSASR